MMNLIQSIFAQKKTRIFCGFLSKSFFYTLARTKHVVMVIIIIIVVRIVLVKFMNILIPVFDIE